MLVKGDYVMPGVHACLPGVRHAASDSTLKTTVFFRAARIHTALRLVCVVVTNTLFGTSLVSPEGLVAVVMVAVVSAATLGQGDTGVTIEDEPWVALAGLHTSQGAGA